MARRRRGRAVDGILLLDKPVGLSSNQALQRARGIYRAQKAGHGGTLDPFASGLLPILFGEASKFGRFILDADKTYCVTLTFGSETDSDDHTGNITRSAAVPQLDPAQWQDLLQRFHGVQQQEPPIYSALKINGQRAYALARRGEAPELAARPITVHQLDLLEHAGAQATLRVRCSKGTYIRALARDIGRAAGSAAHASALRRVAVGELRTPLHDLDTLSAWRRDDDWAALEACLLPLERCVATLPTAQISSAKLRYFENGNDVALDGYDYPPGTYAFYHDGHLLGVGRIADGRAWPERLRRRAED